MFRHFISTKWTSSSLGIRSAFSSLSIKNASTFGVVFDIDGVLTRGKVNIPGASDVLAKLQQGNVPHIFMTNGGGVTEQSRAKHLSEKFNVMIHEDQVCLCHTPMSQLVDQHRDDVVLAIGKDHSMLHVILKNYGFQRVVTVDDVHGHIPTIFPDLSVSKKENSHVDKDRIGAIFIMIDPIYWGREFQIIMDVLQSDGFLANRTTQQQIPVYTSCSDFKYPTEYPHPRFGAGTFRCLLEHLYQKVVGVELKQELYGKPELASYKFAESMLHSQALKKGFQGGVQRIYAIGDNPETDIKGANGAGEKWISILTRSGIFQGQENDPIHSAKVVVQDVNEALRFIEENENF